MKEYIQINPVEELLKGIEIVHGKNYADLCRQIVWKIQDSGKYVEQWANTDLARSVR